MYLGSIHDVSNMYPGWASQLLAHGNQHRLNRTRSLDSSSVCIQNVSRVYPGCIQGDACLDSASTCVSHVPSLAPADRCHTSSILLWGVSTMPPTCIHPYRFRRCPTCVQFGPCISHGLYRKQRNVHRQNRAHSSDSLSACIQGVSRLYP